MRFTSNAFIVSTVALLSLITPLVYADNEVTVTTPAAGQVVNAFDSIEIAWTINDSTDLANVNCIIGLTSVDENPDVPQSINALQSNVPILQGHSNGNVQIPDLVSATNYFIEILSQDQNTVFGQSGEFTIL